MGHKQLHPSEVALRLGLTLHLWLWRPRLEGHQKLVAGLTTFLERIALSHSRCRRNHLGSDWGSLRKLGSRVVRVDDRDGLWREGGLKVRGESVSQLDYFIEAHGFSAGAVGGILDVHTPHP